LAHVSQQQSSNPSPAGPSNDTTSTNPQNNRWDGVVLWYKFSYWCEKLWIGCALSGVCQCCQLQGGYMHYCFCACPVFHCHPFWVKEEGFMATLLRVWNPWNPWRLQHGTGQLYSCLWHTPKRGEQIVVPHKKRSVLASNGLIGKIHLESNWDDEELFGEVRSVFKDAMGGDMNFPFTFLVPTGGGLKSLTKPVLSTNYKWTAKEVAGRADSTVYILAEKAMNSGVVDVVKGVSHSQPCCRGRNWEIDASIYQLVSHDQTQFCTKGRRLGHGYRAVCTNDSVIFIALYCHVPDPISCCKMWSGHVRLCTNMLMYRHTQSCMYIHIAGSQVIS